MGILDKMKEAAGGVAEATKKGTAQVQSKVHQSQLRKKADEAAKRLGYLVHQERTADTPAGEEADKLVAEISDLEKQIAEGAAAEGETGSSSEQGESPAG